MLKPYLTFLGNSDVAFAAQMRYKRKRVSKKLLQKLEIDFSDSDGEAKTNAGAKSHQTNSSNSGI